MTRSEEFQRSRYRQLGSARLAVANERIGQRKNAHVARPSGRRPSVSTEGAMEDRASHSRNRPIPELGYHGVA